MSGSNQKSGHTQLSFRESASLDPVKKKQSVSSRLFDYKRKQPRSLRCLKNSDLGAAGADTLHVHHNLEESHSADNSETMRDDRLLSQQIDTKRTEQGSDGVTASTSTSTSTSTSSKTE